MTSLIIYVPRQSIFRSRCNRETPRCEKCAHQPDWLRCTGQAQFECPWSNERMEEYPFIR